MIDFATLSDSQLQQLSASGDRTAEDALVGRYMQLVRACSRPFFLAGGESEDLIQEGMIGLISAAISTGVLALLYRAAIGMIERAGLDIAVIPFTQMLLPLVFCFIAVGVLVGFFGGFISIRKYLKKEGNEIIGW